MNRAKSLDTKDFVAQIERLTKQRMSQEKVVSLDQIKGLGRTQAKPFSLLMIEDDPSVRRSLTRLFQNEGYTVHTAADATELSQILDGKAIDLILLDVGLPWINGFELAELMKCHKDLKKIPLIFISGHTTEADVKKGFQMGADDYIKKPFNIENVRRTVRTLLHLAYD